MPTRDLLDAIDKNLLVVVAGCFLVTTMSVIGLVIKVGGGVVKKVLDKGLHEVVHGDGNGTVSLTKLMEGQTIMTASLDSANGRIASVEDGQQRLFDGQEDLGRRADANTATAAQAVNLAIEIREHGCALRAEHGGRARGDVT